MRGIGPVRIGGEVVYAYFVVDGRTAKLRLSPDECHRHELFRGQQARIGLDGREAVSALVTAVVPAPPFVWVEAEIAVAAKRAG